MSGWQGQESQVQKKNKPYFVLNCKYCQQKINEVDSLGKSSLNVLTFYIISKKSQQCRVLARNALLHSVNKMAKFLLISRPTAQNEIKFIQHFIVKIEIKHNKIIESQEIYYKLQMTSMKN